MSSRKTLERIDEDLILMTEKLSTHMARMGVTRGASTLLLTGLVPILVLPIALHAADLPSIVASMIAAAVLSVCIHRAGDAIRRIEGVAYEEQVVEHLRLKKLDARHRRCLIAVSPVAILAMAFGSMTIVAGNGGADVLDEIMRFLLLAILISIPVLMGLLRAASPTRYRGRRTAPTKTSMP